MSGPSDVLETIITSAGGGSMPLLSITARQATQSGQPGSPSSPTSVGGLSAGRSSTSAMQPASARSSSPTSPLPIGPFSSKSASFSRVNSAFVASVSGSAMTGGSDTSSQHQQRSSRHLSLIPPGEGFFDRRRSSAKILEDNAENLVLPVLERIATRLRDLNGRAVVQLYDLLSRKTAAAPVSPTAGVSGTSGRANSSFGGVAGGSNGNESDSLVDPAYLGECVAQITGVTLNVSELNALARSLSSRGTGIGIVEFITSLNGGLPTRRVAVVTQSFKQMMQPKRATINYKDALSRYVVEEHPKVLSGDATPAAISTEFSAYWTRDRPDGDINLIEWLFYFAGMSTNIDTDADFETFMFKCWGVKPQAQSNALNTFKVKRAKAALYRQMEYILNDPRLFRSALDLCIMRNPVQDDNVGSRDYLQYLLSDMYLLFGHQLDDSTFQAIFRNVAKEIQNLRTVTEMEDLLRGALQKELTFMEYCLYAKTTD
ncbi:hypothetical protein BC831DRAFT_549816 [Entophlyctis helioformis]|nr:hypothetical protein BC831DRAFT_549816 [Entophlyctis helioformis]